MQKSKFTVDCVEINLARSMALANHLIDSDTKKLSDKYEKIKKSHKHLEKLVMDFRTVLLAMQDKIDLTVCPKCIEKKLREVNLALGFNQWTNVKGDK